MQIDYSAIEPDRIYTLDEAAAHLRLTNRAVAKLARKYGYCLVFGRTILLKGSDIDAIKDTMRVEAKAPRPAPVVSPLSDHRLSQSLQHLTSKRRKRA